MGESIPIGWSIVPLSDMVEKFQNGFAFSAKDYVDVGIPIVTMGSIQLDGTFKTKNTKLKYWNIEDRNKLSRYLVNPHDLIIAMTDVTPTMELIGRSCIVRGKQEYLLNQRVGLIFLNSLIASKIYFAYYSNSEKWRSYCVGSSGLGAQANLGTEQILNGPVLLPPLPEQKKIATILTSVDTVIEKTQAQIDKLNDLKTGMMQELLTKGIGHSNFKPLGNWHTGRIADISQIPETWELVELGEVAKLETGHTPSRDVKEYWGGSIQWLSLHDTKQLNTHTIFSTMLTITEAGIDNSSARLLPAGTVALSRTASVGNCVLFGQEMATSQDFANYVCGEKLEPTYLLHMFKWMQHVWTKLAEGSTHKTIYMPVFKRLQILLPPLEEQKKIAESATTIDYKIRKLTEKHNSLLHIKKALMQDLLTGKVRVTPDPE